MGAHLDQGTPPPVTVFLFILLTWLQWPRPLTGYAKKNQKYKQKIELQQNYYWMFVGSPEHLEMAPDILLMLALPPSLILSLFSKDYYYFRETFAVFSVPISAI